jgi:hypothetical protein
MCAQFSTRMTIQIQPYNIYIKQLDIQAWTKHHFSSTEPVRNESVKSCVPRHWYVGYNSKERKRYHTKRDTDNRLD